MIRKGLVIAVLLVPAGAVSAPCDADFKLKKSTPVLTVEKIEPSLPFWTETLGFTVATKVGGGEGGEGPLDFAMLTRDDTEVMLQTASSLAGDKPSLAEEVRGDAAFLYMEVESLDAIIGKLRDVDIVVPKRDTFYGATEITVREPGGHYLTFAEFARPAGEQPATAHPARLAREAAQPAATIDDVAWMAGSWTGEAFGGTTEEHWTPPSTGAMAGIFKLMHGDDLYEFMLVTEEAGSLVMKLKHFSAAFAGWEGKDDFISFPLVEIDGTAARFDGLTYRRDGDDRMTIFLAVGTDEGVREEVIPCRRTGGR